MRLALLALFSSSAIAQEPAAIDPDKMPSLWQLMEYAATPLAEDHNNCGGEVPQNVGQVLASILDPVLVYKMPYKINYQCKPLDGKQECWMDSTLCEDSGDEGQLCESRILQFTADKDATIIPASFQCIDVP